MKTLLRTGRFALVVALVVATGAAAFAIWKATRPKLQLRTCFHSYSGLAPGANVRLGGVEVGRVRNIRNEIPDCPVDVEFELAATKQFHSLPSNATARLGTEGILGPAYLEIVLPKSPGPAI